ncbi:BppU family phage baseplate upper protein [Clostridium perfringens]|uniref:BppU family phage baseplate upper protein n=1 Tax=Clostridium perfringens TaxID=1502 RepID=UPI0024BD4A19|nr:BppU family phage baseplate upper protein [Clostridium perfringens]
MSEIGLNINVDSYNNEGIKTIKGNNNAEIYKLYILKNKRRLSLVGKTVKLGYVMAGTTKGDVIENLNITNAEQGEITFPITNRISKQDGVYSCQLAIYGADGFLEHTATFGLTVEANIFTKIAGEIADSKDFTYLENILDKASKLSEKLKENTSSATNANSNLESNITEANNINSKLLENTSTATSLNKNLESNINLAKEVKETIKDLDTKNIEATSKIERLEGLNAKAEELSNNINEALPVKDALVKNTEEAKAANTNLLAANQEATSKNTELQASLEKTKEFINGLDGSQNIPQIRIDVTELQNGLKSNQALAYKGSSINAENTLEGRTEGMRIGGRTLNNLYKPNNIREDAGGKYILVDTLVKDEPKDRVVYIVNNTNRILLLNVYKINGGWDSNPIIRENSISKLDLTGKKLTGFLGMYDRGWTNSEADKELLRNTCIVLDRKETYIPQKYFEGLKSFGEAEKVEDKYKISILSTGKNLLKKELDTVGQEITIPKIGDYTFSFDSVIEGGRCGVYIIYEGKTLVSKTFNNGKVNLTLNIQQTDGLLVKVGAWDSGSRVVSINNSMMVEGVESTSYEPYQSNKKDIFIKEPLRENDVLYEDNGQVKVYRPTKQYTFTGNETSIIKWATVKDENFIGFCITNDDIPNLTSKRSLVVCNNFPSVDGVITKRNMYIAANSVNICIEKSALATPDIEGFRAWLKANPTTIVYQLATPTVEIVENCVDIDLDTFQEKTYFSIENSLPGTLDFKVPSNLGSSLQNLAKEVNNIWDVINNLLVPSILKANGNLAMIKLNNNLK